MAAPTATRLRRERHAEGAVLRLVLDAGKGNVIDRALLAELVDAARDAGEDQRLAAVVLDHEGDHFSFGASVEEHRPEVVRDMLHELSATAEALLDLDVPLLAAVRGLCLGGGLELALLADRLVAAPGARFGQPEIQLAVFAPIGSALLPRIVGPRVAADLLLSGRTVEAEEALALGLVAELAPDPGAAALAWASEHLVPKSAAAMRFAVRAARWSWRAVVFEDLRALEALYLEELMQTADAPEGIQAFLEKRPPRWEHR